MAANSLEARARELVAYWRASAEAANAWRDARALSYTECADQLQAILDGADAPKIPES